MTDAIRSWQVLCGQGKEIQRKPALAKQEPREQKEQCSIDGRLQADGKKEEAIPIALKAQNLGETLDPAFKQNLGIK